MRIGIVGTGNMGRTISYGWAVAGYEVAFGARQPAAAREGAALATAAGATRVRAVSNAEAVACSDVVLYTIRDVPPADVIGPGLSGIDGKIVIDLNNWSEPPGSFAFGAMDESLAEKLQAAIPQARVVKCFNTMSLEMCELQPEMLRQGRVAAFVAGNDRAARATLSSLASDLGFSPVDMGPLRNARIVEPLGDVIRYLILGTGLGPFAALRVDTLEAQASGRFGGWRASSWWASNAGARDAIAVARAVGLDPAGRMWLRAHVRVPGSP